MSANTTPEDNPSSAPQAPQSQPLVNNSNALSPTSFRQNTVLPGYTPPSPESTRSFYVRCYVENVIPAVALVDSGACITSVSERYINAHGVHKFVLDRPLRFGDWTGKNHYVVRYYAEMLVVIGTHFELLRAVVADTSNDWDILLSDKWLRDHNPEIDFRARTLRLTHTRCSHTPDDNNFFITDDDVTVQAI